MLKKLIVAAVLTAVAGISAAAGLRVVTVQTEGTGPSRDKAITAALAEAVARVNGLALDSRDVSKVRAEIRNTNVEKNGKTKSDTKAKLSEGLDRETATKTQGSVKSYQVLDAYKSDDAWIAKLSVDINKFESDAQSDRRRIAVLPFRQKGPQQDMFADQLNQSLVNYLTGTRHFAVLDRDYQKERLGELKSLMRDDVQTAERARIGNSLGTDYIVTGTVEELHKKRVTSKVPFTNETVTRDQVRIVVSWRVIEAATGQIMVSNTVSEKRMMDVEDADQGTAGRLIGDSIGQTITDIIYPILVLSYREADKSVVLGQGGNTLKAGDEYQLVKYGALIEDPYTGEKSAREEIPVGLVRISRVSPKTAYGEVIESKVDLVGAAPREYILRPMTAAEKKAARPAAKKTMTPAW